MYERYFNFFSVTRSREIIGTVIYAAQDETSRLQSVAMRHLVTIGSKRRMTRDKIDVYTHK